MRRLSVIDHLFAVPSKDSALFRFLGMLLGLLFWAAFIDALRAHRPVAVGTMAGLAIIGLIFMVYGLAWGGAHLHCTVAASPLSQSTSP
jgi:hypothetical protein